MRSIRKFRTGLIGAGYISRYHLSALRRLANVELVGVCDTDGARAARVAAEAGVSVMPNPQALRDAGAQVLHVLTPPESHAALTIEALKLGCHVLLEKPVADSAEDIARIEQAAANARTHVCVDHSLLFDPQVRKALHAVRRGAIGRLVSVDIIRSSAYPAYSGGFLPPHRRSAGYPFRDLGVHALYLLEAFLGPIADVQAQWSTLGGRTGLAFDEWRAQVRCRDGMGQVHLSWNVRPLQSQIILQGTRGVMRVDLFLMFQSRRAALPLPRSAERIINAATDSIKPLVDVTRGSYGFARGRVLQYHGLQQLVAAFYRSLADDAECPVNLTDAARVARWTEHVASAADRDHARTIQSFSLSDKVPILVTGASGALGSQVVWRFQSQGTAVRILVRRPISDLPAKTELVIGDLGDPQAVDRAVKGARIVIHAGAATRGAWIDHQCATIAGTRNVLEACRKHSVEKLVHISSLSVADWASHLGTNLNESSALEPHPEKRGHYTRAKLEAERLVTAFCQEHRLPTVILRPGQIFGGSIPLVTPAVARQCGRWWIVLGDGRLQLPLVSMDDVVDAIMAAARSPLCDGEIIQLVDPASPTQNEALASVMYPNDRVLHIPRAILLTAGKLSEFAFGLFSRTSPVSAYRLRSALTPRTFHSDRARNLIDWTPRIGAKTNASRIVGAASATPSTEHVDAAAIEAAGLP